MGARRRLELIGKLEEDLKGRVVVYFLGDHPASPAMLADDSMRPMYEELRRLVADSGDRRLPRIILYLYSQGGNLATPWKLVNLIRAFCKEFQVLIPYNAYSAATLIAMGADKILMTDMGRLGPIDPLIRSGPAESIGVEDVSAYVRFVKDRMGIQDQAALGVALEALSKNVNPSMLGQLERLHSHIRLVATKLLSLHTPPYPQQEMAKTTEILAEKSYLHGHGIERGEAKSIGLDVKALDGRVCDLSWDLYREYEALLKLDRSHDLRSLIPDKQESYSEPAFSVAVIESAKSCHACRGTLELKRQRKMPPQNPQLNMNLSIKLPPFPASDPQTGEQATPPDIAQLQKAMKEQLQVLIPQMVQSAIALQWPEESIQARLSAHRWLDVTDERDAEGD